jgi:hypothetical protein
MLRVLVDTSDAIGELDLIGRSYGSFKEARII